MAAAVFEAADVSRWLRDIAPSAQLSLDSRRVQRGDVFIACPGENGDGRDFIPQAIEAGARAVLFDVAGDFQWKSEWHVEHCGVPGLAASAGRIAHEWYSKPDSEMFSLAVTGTNGKTSCTQWLGQALSRLPLDPRVGRMLLAAREQNALQEALVIAAALSVPDVRDRPVDAQTQARDASSHGDQGRVK